MQSCIIDVEIIGVKPSMVESFAGYYPPDNKY